MRFEADDEQSPLRLWDNVDGDLVERDPSAPDFSRSDVLGAYWVIDREPKKGRVWLRLAHDAAGKKLILTPVEHAEAERERAEARLVALEAELALLKGQR